MRRRLSAWLLGGPAFAAPACAGAALVLALAGCEPGSGSTPRARGTPTAFDPAVAGTIAGTVRATGALPAPRRVRVTGDSTCAARHPDGIVVDAVVVDDRGGLADAFVWVKRGLEDRVFAVPAEPVVVDQRDCRFVPSVTGVRAGQTIELRNSDATLHNVHGAPRRSPPWNVGLGAAGATRTLVVEEPETMVPIGCNVHSWMRAWLGVIDHPYFAVTGPDGTFRLPGIPAGDYVVAAWHPVLGERDGRITVTAAGTATIDLVLAAPAPPP